MTAPDLTPERKTGSPGGRRAALLGALACLPGLLLLGASLAGRSPSLRDLPGYFVPLREHAAEVLVGRASPFWTEAVGCGEPVFANPQHGLLYPLAWGALLLPAWQAVGVEAGLHLGLLGLGCFLLALRLGARPSMALAGAWGAVLAGPLSDAAGVLNNLDTLAWAPWVWWAALSRSAPATAAFLALAYLGAEPQLAVVTGLVALALAPRRRTVLAVALALGLVAVQVAPFLAWVQGGDRGPTRDLDAVCAGSLALDEALALAAPSAVLPERSDRFVANLTLPWWLAVLGVAALLGRDRPRRTLAVAAGCLLALAALPNLPWGQRPWALLTGGLLRYPARLVLPAVVALAPAAAASLYPGRRLLAGSALAALVPALGAWLLDARPLEVGVQVACSLGCAVAGVAPWAAALSALALLPGDVGHLQLQPRPTTTPLPCLEAQLPARGRVYAVQPSRDQQVFVAAAPRRRGAALGWGYVALADGRHLARTFAPLQSRRLAAHLAEADRGPAGRWWLDALAADRMLSHHDIPGFPATCADEGLVVLANPGAWPEVSLLRRVPGPGEPPEAGGDVAELAGHGARRSWRVRADGASCLVWSACPDPGWRFAVDGRRVAAVEGPGILQGVPVPAGEHTVTATYLPRGVLAGGAVSLASLACLLVLARRRGPPDVSPPGAPPPGPS